MAYFIQFIYNLTYQLIFKEVITKLIHPSSILSQEDLKNFERRIFEENLHRCKLFAKIIVAFETVLIINRLVSSFIAGQGWPAADVYILMYSLLLLMSLLFLYYIYRYEAGDILSQLCYLRARQGIQKFVAFFYYGVRSSR